MVELCQSHVRTLWVTLLGDGNQSPQVTHRIFDMPRVIIQGKGEVVRGGQWQRVAGAGQPSTTEAQQGSGLVLGLQAAGGSPGAG